MIMGMILILCSIGAILSCLRDRRHDKELEAANIRVEALRQRASLDSRFKNYFEEKDFVIKDFEEDM